MDNLEKLINEKEEEKEKVSLEIDKIYNKEAIISFIVSILLTVLIVGWMIGMGENIEKIVMMILTTSSLSFCIMYVHSLIMDDSEKDNLRKKHEELEKEISKLKYELEKSKEKDLIKEDNNIQEVKEETINNNILVQEKVKKRVLSLKK